MKYGFIILVLLLLIPTASAYTQTVNITFESIEEYHPKSSSDGVGNATIVNSTEYFAQFANYSDLWVYNKPINIPEQIDFDEYIFYDDFEDYESEMDIRDDLRWVIPEIPFSYSSMCIKWGWSY